MAQLSDDCFAFGGALLSVDDALAWIEERVTAVVETERIPLGGACGRILARDVVASMNLPPHANSAVDGYAFAHADLTPSSPPGGALRSGSLPALRCRMVPTR